MLFDECIWPEKELNELMSEVDEEIRPEPAGSPAFIGVDGEWHKIYTMDVTNESD